MCLDFHDGEVGLKLLLCFSFPFKYGFYFVLPLQSKLSSMPELHSPKKKKLYKSSAVSGFTPSVSSGTFVYLSPSVEVSALRSQN